MKIELELPDWVDQGQAIRIFAGIELVAKKEFPDEPWKIKTVRCNMCGKCCMNKSENWMKDTVGYDPETNYCGALIEKDDESGKFICNLGSARPFSCCAYAVGINDKDICSIRWEIVK